MGIQVYTSTHDGQGNSLPRAEKQFISFSYGGKNIEDFDLLAVFVSDRLSKNIYSAFSETTTQSTGLDGQKYWLFQYNALTIHFDLSTDGMGTKELEEFKNWFVPGIERELILAEYPNRYILARVASTPVMNMLPFENKIETKIGGESYTVSSSIYKGDISLDLVADYPFWRAKENLITNETPTADELKTIQEDGIPYFTMFSGISKIILPGGIIYKGE